MSQRTRAAHEKAVAAWICAYLSERHAVTPEVVKGDDLIKHWGIVHEGRLADLIGAFNRSAYIAPVGKHMGVSPPELIKAMGDDAFGQPVSQLSSMLASATSRPDQKTVEDSIVVCLRADYPDVRDATSRLDSVSLDPPEMHLIDTKCDPVRQRAGASCQACIDWQKAHPTGKRPHPTVASVAACIRRSM